MRIVLFALVFMNLNPMERKDYEKSAKEKADRYAGFVQVMNMLENNEHCISLLSARRQFTQLNINTLIVVDQDEEDFIILSREDFEGA